MKTSIMYKHDHRRAVICWALLLLTLILGVSPIYADEDLFNKFTDFTVEGINLSMTREQAESVLQQQGYKKINKHTWRFMSGKQRVCDIRLTSYEGVLTKVSIVRNAPNKKLFADFEKEFLAIKSRFAGTKTRGEFTSKGGLVDFFLGQRSQSPYHTSINFNSRRKIYGLNFIPSNVERYIQHQAKKQADGLHHCLDADPTSFDEVFKCMSGIRYPDGTSQFSRDMESRDCTKIWIVYRQGLIEAGVPQSAVDDHKPSCDIFAQAIWEIAGKPGYWANCLGYQGTNKKHVKQCLEGFIPYYYGNNGTKEQALKQAGDCNKLKRDYKRALIAASTTNSLPKGYKPLNCEMANNLLAAWNPQVERSMQGCQGYNPDAVAPHLEQCLAMNRMQLATLKNCIQVRDLYEDKLRKTSGSLPASYTLLRCSDTKAILTEAKAVREEIIKKQQEEMARRTKSRAEKIAASNKYWNNKIIESRKFIENLDVKKGPVVQAELLAELENKVNIGVNLGNIREYDQPGLLLALFAREYELIQPRRGAALTYINAFHEAYANSKHPSCKLASSPQVRRVLENGIMSQLGFDKALSSNSMDTSALGIGVVLSLMVETSTQGGMPIIERLRNMEFIKEQAEYDALRLAQAPNCNQDTVKALFDRAIEFVQYRP